MTDRRIDELIEKALPTNWLDSLLTGPHAVIGQPPYDSQDIERVLRAVRMRVLAALVEPQEK